MSPHPGSAPRRRVGRSGFFYVCAVLLVSGCTRSTPAPVTRVPNSAAQRLFGYDTVLKGVTVDDTGQPLTGVRIRLEGNGAPALSDTEGMFQTQLSAKPGERRRIEFEYRGREWAEVFDAPELESDLGVVAEFTLDRTGEVKSLFLYPTDMRLYP